MGTDFARTLFSFWHNQSISQSIRNPASIRDPAPPPPPPLLFPPHFDLPSLLVHLSHVQHPTTHPKFFSVYFLLQRFPSAIPVVARYSTSSSDFYVFFQSQSYIMVRRFVVCHSPAKIATAAKFLLLKKSFFVPVAIAPQIFSDIKIQSSLQPSNQSDALCSGVSDLDLQRASIPRLF